MTPIRAAALAAVLGLAAAPAAVAQVSRSTPGQPEARTALDLMPAKARLTVTTPAFKDGGDIPFENTEYRSNTFPGLSWTTGPKARHLPAQGRGGRRDREADAEVPA